MDLSTLRSNFYDSILQDASVGTDVWDTTRVNRALNRSAKHVAQIIKRHAPEEFLTSGTFNTVGDTREYDLLDKINANFEDLHRVERNAIGETERPIPMELDRVYDRGRRAIGNRLYLRSHFLGFYIAPTSVFTLTVHYAPDIANMGADDKDLSTLTFQNPRIRDAFHDAIWMRAAYQAIGAEGGDTSFWRSEYDRVKLEMIRTLQQRRRGPRYIRVVGRAARFSRGRR